jgi:hypothetical protein
LGILEQRVSVTTERTRWWTNSMDCSFPWFTTLIFFISGDICSPLFVLQKTVTSSTFNKGHRMGSRWFARHMEFSSQLGNRCSDMQLTALKLKVNT